MLAVAGYVALGVLYLTLLALVLAICRAARDGDEHLRAALRAHRAQWSWDAQVDGEWRWPR